VLVLLLVLVLGYRSRSVLGACSRAMASLCAADLRGYAPSPESARAGARHRPRKEPPAQARQSGTKRSTSTSSKSSTKTRTRTTTAV